MMAFSRSYGDHIRTIKIDGLAITDSKRPPQEMLPRHSHEFTNINLVLGGTFRETIGTFQKDCFANQIVIRPGGEFHTDRYGERGAHCLIIELAPERLKMLLPHCSVLDRADHFESTWLRPQIQRFYREFQMSDTAAMLAMDSCLLDLLSKLSSNEDGRGTAVPSWLKRANEMLQDRYCEEITIGEIAAEVGVHPAHLSRAFRKHFRVSPGEFVRDLRLEFAASQLAGTTKSLTEVATASGFYDQSHFNRLFKVRYGTTPAKYRFVCKSRTK